MPYKLRKVPKQNLYWVVNKDTGKKYSKEGLPKERAERQLRALYRATGTERGGDEPVVLESIPEEEVSIPVDLNAESFPIEIPAPQNLLSKEDAFEATYGSGIHARARTQIFVPPFQPDPRIVEIGRARALEVAFQNTNSRRRFLVSH